MKKSAYVVGLMGAELVGQEIASALEDRAFPLAALRIFGGQDILGEAVDVGARGMVASPDPVGVALSTVLAPLHALAGVRRAVVTTMEAVSGAGAAGIDELSRQTVEVLNGRSVESDVFPSRICFNVLPWIGTV